MIVSTAEEQRRALLKTVTAEQLCILKEIALNIYKGTILERNDIEALRPHASLIRKLSDREVKDSVTIKCVVRNHEAVSAMIEPFLALLEGS
ncbi:hypothetical protein BOW16_13010 [Solemya velum gill symbiont]|nr:hypothetical protein BOW04_12250 [Solemya velum gill symbiont]OOY62634.1 hypothetical protein BOW05_13060 [Solemya velum gill symbiont]OOY67334.1 hypothetical protein BOW07_13070 [Solemya velum gill symbiont]OOY69706.1 hypothetical protein BOW08_12305 [Solemya velum gill symbiont]OOY72086.1 hypothetical protein BOW09_12240 [Solemya velum gill symbiont]